MKTKEVRGTTIIYLDQGESLSPQDAGTAILFDQVNGASVYIKPSYLSQSLTFSYEDNPFLDEAKKICETVALDRIQPTGTVIVKDNEIIASAGNGKFYEEPADCERKKLNVESGTRYDLCDGNHDFPNHSERRATESAKEKLSGAATDLTAYLYGHWWCCEPCSQAMEGVGVTRVVMSKQWVRDFLEI